MYRFGNFFKPLMWSMAMLLSAFVAGCGGDGDDAVAPVAPVAPIGDITGAWTITETGITSTTPQCNSPALPLNLALPVTFTQTGSTLSVASGPDTFAGTVSGSTVNWTGSFLDNGGAGTTTINSLSATVDPTCTTMSAGTMNWTYVEPGGFTCTADTTFTAAEDVPGAC